MGGFYGSIQIRGVDHEAIKVAVEKLARKTNIGFLLGPKLSDWIGVYPERGGQDSQIGRELARKLRAEQFHLIVHDDDVFTYEYYRAGKLVDQFNSRPDYFEEVSKRTRQKLRGQPERFAHLLIDQGALDKLKKCLSDADVEVFANVSLQSFSEAIGIRNAVTSYEYLQGGETDVIDGWDQFIQVPDPADEKARGRRAAAELENTKLGLIRDGLLLKELTGKAGVESAQPWYCAGPDSSSFLVAWSTHCDSPGSLCPLEICMPPWSEPLKPTSLSIESNIYSMALSPSGRYLGMAHAGGAWKATLWDLVDNRRVVQSPQPHVVSWVGFTPDEKAMVSVSTSGEVGQVVIEPVDGSPARTLSLEHANQAAVHPGGQKLAISDNRNRLRVVDVASLKVEHLHFVGGRRDVGSTQLGLIAEIKAATAHVDYAEMEKQHHRQIERMFESVDPTQLPPGVESIEAFKEQMRQGVNQNIAAMRRKYDQLGTPEWLADQIFGAVAVLSLIFDTSGDRLCIGTGDGVHVYRWNQIVEARDVWPQPSLVVNLEPRLDQTSSATRQQEPSVLTLEYDPDRDWLVFGSLDGRVRYLDLHSGRSGVLVEPPGRWPIVQIALSRDRTALGLKFQPDYLSTSSKRPGPVLQFWNYPALCQTAALQGPD